MQVGFRFAQYLKDHPGLTYDDLAEVHKVTKARVCQLIALYNRLPSGISDYLLTTNDPEILKYFTERRLRPLTLLKSDKDKFIKFDEMIKEAMAVRE